MINYGLTKSTVKPEDLEILSNKVFVCTDITESDGLYTYNLVEYGKDEYIKLQAEQSIALSNQITDTQLALTEVYEQMIGE